MRAWAAWARPPRPPTALRRDNQSGTESRAGATCWSCYGLAGGPAGKARLENRDVGQKGRPKTPGAPSTPMLASSIPPRAGPVALHIPLDL